MLDFYHIGAYGQVHQQKWSCCNAANRNIQGCQRTTIAQSHGNKQHHRAASFKMESRSPSKVHRRYNSVRTHGTQKPLERARSPSPIYHDAREDPEGPSQISQSLATSTTTFFKSKPERHDTVSLLMRQESQTDSLQ